MFSIRMTIAAAAVTMLVGCKQQKLSVDVNCEAKTREAIECDVHQTAGTSEMDVCWDLTATCPNGAKVTAPHTCQKVKDGATAKTLIPIASLANVDSCQGGKPSMAITNLTINGKKAQ